MRKFKTRGIASLSTGLKACGYGLLISLLLGATVPRAQNASRPPLSAGDVDALAKILMLEDTRTLDTDALREFLKSSHQEVRRRAIIAVGRIVKDGAGALLQPLRTETDPTLLGAVVFATGQVREAGSVPWLAEILNSETAPPEVSREAARSLGKITAPESRSALAAFLTTTPASPGARASAVGEALLSIGRFGKNDDVAPMLRWATSPDVEIRWRAAWALFRCGSAAAVPQLMKLAKDEDPEVRFWSVRGLSPTAVDAARIDRAVVSTLLRAATRDADRRVRTESLRALGLFTDDDAYKVVLATLETSDTWMSVSAAEALARYKDHADIIVPRLQAVIASASTPVAVKATALTSLATLAPDAAIDAATTMIKASPGYARTAAIGALGGRGLGAAGRARLDELAADPETKDLVPAPGAGRGGGAGGGGARAPQPAHTLDEYRAIVERWIVPDYNGDAKPRAILETPKGAIEIELYAGDAPLGMEHFVRVVTSGSIVGTLFTRVVPNFVDQQAGISDATTLRDEVNQRGLLRGTLSWASSGLDTGRPGYTLGNTPQPHNEGNFTALGHVVSGMDVVDHTELGDAITAARMVKLPVGWDSAFAKATADHQSLGDGVPTQRTD